MLDFIRKNKLNIGLSLLAQAASFVILFFLLYKKKRSLSAAFLTLASIGGAAGAYLVLKAAKEEAEAYEQAAKDAFRQEHEPDCFDFGNCDSCSEDCADAKCGCEVVVEEAEEIAFPDTDDVFTEEAFEIPTEEASVSDSVLDTLAENAAMLDRLNDEVKEAEAFTEEIVADAPIEDIFTESVKE